MKQYKIAAKLYYRDMVLVAATIIFFVYLNLLHLDCSKELSGYLIMGDLSMLMVTMGTSLWCFTFFSFISYYYLDKLRFDSQKECMQSIFRGVEITYKNQILVLFTVVLVFTATLMGYNFYAYWVLQINHAEALVHILLCVFLYIFCISLTGIGLGMLAALKLKRLMACSVISLFVVISSPIFLRFIETLYYTFKIDIFPVYEFICIFPRGLTAMPQHFVGYSLLPDRISAVFFWITLFYSLSLLHILRGKHVKQIAVASIGILVCCASFSVYLTPGTKTLTANNSQGEFAIDRMFYLFDYSPQNKPACFYITEYNMDLKIDTQLEAEVTVVIDTPELAVYNFTLYHGYKVSGISDQDGNKLAFKQEGDYIEVFSDSNNILTLTFKYKGYNPTYYSHSQGISLPGHFVYYPRSGYQTIYDVKNQGFYNVLLEKPVNFTIKIDYNKEVYCNLTKTGDNTFSGITDGCTILAGFLTSETIENVEVVYPYLDTEQFGHGFLEDDVYQFLKQKEDYNNINKIMILPYVNMGTHARCNYYSDGTIVCMQIRTLSNDYLKILGENSGN